jgi:hypothetical protein
MRPELIYSQLKTVVQNETYLINRVDAPVILGTGFSGLMSVFAGPDFWYMKIDKEELVRTTFSNSPGESTYCLRQSYPQDCFMWINQRFTTILKEKGEVICLYTLIFSLSKLFIYIIVHSNIIKIILF